MARGLRPYIPLDIRYRVLLRQLGWAPKDIDEEIADAKDMTRAPIFRGVHRRLMVVLDKLKISIGSNNLHLDHDPPLAARKKVKNKAGVIIGYRPAANDPNHLIYRTAVEHRLKTNVRGEHGQHPDRVLIKKNRKMERREAGIKERPKAKVRGLTFQQQRCRLGVRCRCDRRSRKTCNHYSNLKTRKSR